MSGEETTGKIVADCFCECLNTKKLMTLGRLVDRYICKAKEEERDACADIALFERSGKSIRGGIEADLGYDEAAAKIYEFISARGERT